MFSFGGGGGGFKTLEQQQRANGDSLLLSRAHTTTHKVMYVVSCYEIGFQKNITIKRVFVLLRERLFGSQHSIHTKKVNDTGKVVMVDLISTCKNVGCFT